MRSELGEKLDNLAKLALSAHNNLSANNNLSDNVKCALEDSLL
jgi:hypothetical protein